MDVFLFGSAAEGKNTLDSDLDILVIVPDNYGQIIKDFYNIVTQPYFSPVAVDWIFKTKSEFDIQKEIGGISRIVFLNGMRIKINEFK
jgi:predicted nucleotidyltransferase